LETNIEKRKEIFLLVKQLYGFRSRIAHGEDISRAKKQKDQKNLQRVLESIPIVVAESIIKLMAIWQKNPEISAFDFWQEIELGTKDGNVLNSDYE
jgi:hypothetical protein